MEDILSRHYAALLGLGEEWNVTDVKLDVAARRVDIWLEYAKHSAICPVCGRLTPLHDQQPERTWRHLDTGKAWALKELFGWFWKSRDKFMVKVSNTRKNHLYGLLAWFDSRINNALTEGSNTTMQALKATAKGYRNFENFRTVVLFYCGKLDMRPRNRHSCRGSRMPAAKRSSFGGAGMHRSEAEGRFGEAEPEGCASVCARAPRLGVSHSTLACHSTKFSDEPIKTGGARMYRAPDCLGFSAFSLLNHYSWP